MGAPPNPTVPPSAGGSLPHSGDQPAGTSPEAVGYAPLLEGALAGYRAVKFRTREVDPPAFLYVSQDDFLAVNIATSQSVATVTISCQLLLPDQRLQVMQFPITLNAAEVYAAFSPVYFGLAEGFLLSVTAWANFPNLTTGQIFTQVWLQKGQILSGNLVEQLISGYLSWHKFLNWPGGTQADPWDNNGALKNQIFASFTAGSDISITQPQYTKWRIRSLFAKLTTSATVATRQVSLQIMQTATQQLWQDFVEATQTASTTGVYSWGLMTGSNQTAFQQNHIQRSLPDVPFTGGGVASIQTNTANLQATDQWSVVCLTYEEWLI